MATSATFEDDEILVRRFQNTKESHIFGELFRRHHRTLYYSCLRIVRDHGVAEDLTQDAFVQALRHINDYDEQCFAGWLKQIARNLCLNWLHSAVVRRSTQLSEGVSDLNTPPANSFRDTALDAALKKLSPEQRRCVDLFYNEDLSYEKIAIETGFSYREVKTRLQNSLRRLRLHFKAEVS